MNGGEVWSERNCFSGEGSDRNAWFREMGKIGMHGFYRGMGLRGIQGFWQGRHLIDRKGVLDLRC